MKRRVFWKWREMPENQPESSPPRVTPATPGACSAHTADRHWESDKDIFDRRKDAFDAKFPDTVCQLLKFKHDDGLEVAPAAGRSKFLPNTEQADSLK